MVDNWKQQFLRAETKSIIVSLSDTSKDQEITGFLRDISEGGLKIQKISAKRQIELGLHDCRLILPGLGKIDAKVEVLGFGYDDERFSEHLIRMRFVSLCQVEEDRIRDFVKLSSRTNP